MSSVQNKEQFIKLVQAKLSEAELIWLAQKTSLLSDLKNSSKFAMFFSLSSRFISNEVLHWESKELKLLKKIYPGFKENSWTKLEMVRVVLMLTLDNSKNKQILDSFFEEAEMQELVAFFKGLYLLENAEEFTTNIEEGIRTNMVNVFDSFSSNNPYAITYLEEWAWNQLILKALFMDRPLYCIYNIDNGKNKNLANMLQDFVKERWSAFRPVSPEIWRMIEGYLREDIKILLNNRTFEGIEKDAIDHLLSKNYDINNNDFWNTIGKLN